MKDDVNGVVMGNVWYDIIKNGNVLTSYYTQKNAISSAKRNDADYVVKIEDFEPLEIVWEKEAK